MSEQEIKVPDLGGADEVEIIEITVSEGDSVEEEDPILTVESDKASVELPSPGAGKITKITVKVGDEVKFTWTGPHSIQKSAGEIQFNNCQQGTDVVSAIAGPA